MAITTVPPQMLAGPVFQNSQTINANYTILSGNNAMAVGPVTIASGVTVTISSGARWIIL